MTPDAPLSIFETDVLPEWIDLNGHLNVTYYVRAFDLATDAFMDLVGIGWDYTQAEKRTIFMLEAHVSYLAEVSEGDRLRFDTRLLDYDAKRVHIFHEMFHADDNYLAATSEWLALHVDLETRRSSPIPDFARERLAEIMSAHEGLARPQQVGERIGIRRKTA